jgi:hypothetical protein
MATGNIPVLGGGSVDAKDLAVASANGGLTIFETDKDIYVTAVNQDIINQRVFREFSNVTNANTFVTNTPTGPDTSIQIASSITSNGVTSAAFVGVSELTFGYKSDGSGNSVLSAFGGYFTAIGNIVAAQGDITAANGEVSSNTLNVTDISTFGSDINAYGITNLYGQVNVGNAGSPASITVTANVTANNANIGNTLTVVGNALANNATITHTVTAANFKGVFEANSNAQPNIKSVANTLVIGNVQVYGNSNGATIRAYDSGAAGNIESLDIGVNSQADSANYYININNKGNVTLPKANGAANTAIVKSSNNITFIADTSNFVLYSNGYSNLANTVVANFFSGVFANNSNAQPNITSLGNLTGLQIGNTGAGNEGNANIYGNINVVSTDTANANLGHVWAPWIGNANSNFAGNVANFTEVIVTANANIEKLNVIGNALITKDLTVTGNVYVQGTTNYVNVENLNVEDPIISLGGIANGGAANTDANLGLWLRSNVSDRFIGWRTANTGEFVVASNASVTGNNVTVNTLANIVADHFIGTISGNASGLANGNSNVAVANAGNITMAVAGNANVVTITGTGANINGTANITGNLSAANAALGNLVTANNFTGKLIDSTNVTKITANATALTVDAAGTTGVLTVTGTGANITGTANITGNTISGNFVGVFANGTQSNVKIPTADGNIEFSAAGATTYKVTGTGANVIGNLDVSGNLTAGNLIGPLTTLNGNSSVVVAANADVTITSNSNATLIVSDYSANVTGNLNVSDTLATNNFTITGNFGVGDGGATGTLIANVSNGTGTFNLINANAATVNFAGAATTINMGATSGTLTINNPTIVGSQTTQSLFNTVATTINLGGAATTISIGNTSGTTTVNNDLATTGNIALNGGTLTTTKTTANVLNANATTINLGGAATAINVGATTGTLTVNNPTVVGSQTTQDLWNTVANTINFGGAADINLSTSGKTTTVAGNLSVTGNTRISGDSKLFIEGGDANGQFLKLANSASGNGQTIWANVNWSDLGTTTSGRAPNSIAIGTSASAGLVGSANAVSIGYGAGTGGTTGVAIGQNAGSSGSFVAGSIEINGTGTAASPTSGNAGFYVSPVGDATGVTGTYALTYNTGTKEIGYSTTGVPTAAFATQAGLLAPYGNTTSNVTVAAGGNVTIVSNNVSTIQVSNSAATVTGNLTVTGVNLLANSATTANLGNAVTAKYFIGSGAYLTNVPGAIVTGTVADAANATVATTANSVGAGNITGNTLATTVVTSSLTTVGTLGSLSVTGDIAAATGNINATTGKFNGDGANISNVVALDTSVGAAITNKNITLDASNVGTIDITINGTKYTLYMVPKP